MPLPYEVKTIGGPIATFADQSDAIDFADKKSATDSGAFTYHVYKRFDALERIHSVRNAEPVKL